MNPHRGMRACRFSSGSTASSTAPPTFSKYTSMPSGQAPPRRVRKCRHLSAPPLNEPLSPPDRKRASCVGLCFPLLAEREFTQPVGASPFGRRLRRRVHPLCGDGGLATDGGGLQAASRLAPPAARVVEPVGALIKSPPVPRYAKRPPCGGPFAYLAERGGFEPPKRGLDAYTLSRRAPSTTRTPLRNLAGRRDGLQGRRF